MNRIAFSTYSINNPTTHPNDTGKKLQININKTHGHKQYHTTPEDHQWNGQKCLG